jgi:hypothetical protein
VFPLPSEGRRIVAPNEVMQLSGIDPREEPTPETVYAALGYPWRKIIKRPDQSRIAFRGLAVTGHALPPPHETAISRAQLSMRFARIRMRDGGQRVTAPLPHGMSGGGLFRLTPGTPFLVGVLTNYSPGENRVVATHIAVVLEAIRARFPRLASRIPVSPFRVKTTSPQPASQFPP